MAAPQRTHYDVLGISRDADAGAVRTAWKLHVQAWHPDRFSGEMRDEAERQTQAINEAYTVLRDGGRRAAYDCTLAAAEAAERPEPTATRTSHKVRPAAPRAAAAPVGSPMPMPEPTTLGYQAAAIGRDAWGIVRRHPRVFAVAATVWVLVFGGSMLMHALSAPKFEVTASARSAQAAAVVVDPAQADDLEDLAERAREEAAAADAEMEQLMREDAAIAAAEAKALAREAALAARAAKAAKRPGAATGSGASAAAKRGRVVRVMPSIAR